MKVGGSDSGSHGVPVYDTGAPFAVPDRQVGDALEALEVAAVLDRVAGHAVGELGAAAVRSRRPSADLAWIRAELATVGQVAGLIRSADGVTAERVPDVARTLSRLRVEGSVLEGAEVVGLRQVLTASRLVAAELKRALRDAPLLVALARPVPDRTLERRLEISLDPAGTLLDTASPRLAAARREVQAARDRLIRKLETILRSLETGAGEGTVTVRNGRYVIPVRREARSRPGGIVHDESSSGGTFFIEPSDAVDLGNALREAEVEEERETLRVLRELTARLRPERETIAACHGMCVAVDDLCARAKYAVAVDGQVPEVAAAPARLVIRRGRHPLLCGSLPDVVPFDLELAEGERTVLISGPNTGGKTVLLKAVGLMCALTQCGIVPPVGVGSALPVFQRVFADIGDRQSIAASLSTFSAHVQVLRRILEEADSSTLVLLDEIGSGTDPAEGAALAAASLRSLTERDAITLVSTHLGALKELAAHVPGVVNASLEFDAATLSPTYRFVKGIPGRSYGIAIARRLGVPVEVLEDATARIPDTERQLDAVLAAVEQRERDLLAREALSAERTAGLEALSARLSSQASEQERREAELRRREQEAERLARKETRSYLLEARRRVEEAIGTVKASADEAAAREARRQVEEAIQAESRALQEVEMTQRQEAGLGMKTAIVGQRVRVGNGGTGRVQELRPDGKAVVVVGSMRMVVDLGSLIPVEPSSVPSVPSVSAFPSVSSVSSTSTVPEEIDLRGMTGDEAESATIAAVDAAVLAERPFLRIIHGMGTGVVRERVRKVLAANRRVSRFDFAPSNQGGRGATIAEFAE